MKQFPNIALTGKFRSGKDEVARYLCDKYGYKRFAFGDALKRHYHELFGPTTGKDGEGYQWFGQTMRERDPNIWVRKVFRSNRRNAIGMVSDEGGNYRPSPTQTNTTVAARKDSLSSESTARTKFESNARGRP